MNIKNNTNETQTQQVQITVFTKNYSEHAKPSHETIATCTQRCCNGPLQEETRQHPRGKTSDAIHGSSAIQQQKKVTVKAICHGNVSALHSGWIPN